MCACMYVLCICVYKARKDSNWTVKVNLLKIVI